MEILLSMMMYHLMKRHRFNSDTSFNEENGGTHIFISKRQGKDRIKRRILDFVRDSLLIVKVNLDVT